MASVYKRDGAKNYTCAWVDEAGKRRTKAGTVNRAESLRIAQSLEYRAKQVRLGLVDPIDRRLAEHAARPIVDHLDAYRLDLEAREDDAKHVANTISAIRRLCASVEIEYLGDLTADRVRAGLGRIKAKGRSARTANHALRAVKGFARWLTDSGRLREDPTGLRSLKPYPEEADRRRVRRALTADELDRLLTQTEAGPEYVTQWTARHGTPIRSMTGMDRAMAYRVACATGFRANEIRTLTPERFELEGDSPAITVAASYSKRGKRSGRDDVQPIDRRLAELLRAYLADRPTGEVVWPLPGDRLARMLRADLERAGIPYRDDRGRVIDFHSLRHSYVTQLIRSRVSPKIAQVLARHSDIRLTLDRYTTVEDAEVRKAIEAAAEPRAAHAQRDEKSDSDHG